MVLRYLSEYHVQAQQIYFLEQCITAFTILFHHICVKNLFLDLLLWVYFPKVMYMEIKKNKREET